MLKAPLKQEKTIYATEAARILGVSRAEMNKMIHRGLIVPVGVEPKAHRPRSLFLLSSVEALKTEGSSDKPVL